MSSLLSARIVACGRLVTIAAVLILSVSASAAEKKSDDKSDQDAIRAAVDSYTAAYNRGDARAVASHWSESGEWISPSGQRFQGREAIEKELAALFAANKGLHVEVLQPAIRLLSKDVAVEEGIARATRPGEPPHDSTYLAIHVKKDGQWKMDSVRETDLPETPPAASPLQDLAWLVGEWIDESPEARGETSVTWTKNKTFLSYTFRVSASEMDDLEGTQVIGWDPAAGTIRSWMFDSDGGFGEGTWTKKGNSWIVKFSQVLPDGRKASATNVYTLVHDNTFTWRSIGRKLDGEFLPNVEDVKMVRKGMTKAGKAVEKPGKQRATK
jgi:uncharacterized protein (TIGR02246 family)